MRQAFGFMIGVVVGAVVGSTIALLYAPEPGENVRHELRNRGEAFASDLRHAAETRRIELTNRLEELREARPAGPSGA